MKCEFITFVRCPACGGELVCADCAGTITHGLLRCTTCSMEYPVIHHVPRLLTGRLLAACVEYYKDVIAREPVLAAWHEHYADNIRAACPISPAERKKIATQRNFGYEWTVWRKLPDYAESHFFRIMGRDAAFFEGKTGYDAATGMGRYLQTAARAVGPRGMMIGTDISYAVDMAYERCKDLGNVLVVQADLYSKVIPDHSVDFAFMIGLIQHLTAPAEGVTQVSAKIKPGGYFAGTVYTKPQDWLSRFVVAFIYAMRCITLHLPLPVVLMISRLCAVPAYLFFKLPTLILNRFKYVQEMNKLYPNHGTQNRRPDLDLLAHNWFDHFTAPVIAFYTDDEIRALCAPSGLQELTLSQGIVRAYTPLQ